MSLPLYMLLLGSLAATVPVILHFFYRSRHRVIPWAAMKFLLSSIEQTSRRVRFQELLLLLTRIAVLLLLALALARLTTLNTVGARRGEAVDAVIIIDSSMSMGAREGATTRLSQAKQAAQKIIGQLPRGSTVQIVRCDDRAILAGPRSPTNLDQARQAIEGTEPTDVATDFLAGLNEASAILMRGSAPTKEVYLVSDMQKLGFDHQQGAVKARLDEIRQKATVYMVRCSGRSPRNAAVVGIEAQATIPHTGERNIYGVMVRNTGTQRMENLVVSLVVDGKPEGGDTRPLATLEPGETKTVMLTAKLDRAGPTILTASLGADDLEADNKIERLIDVRDQVRVLVIDGAPNKLTPERAASFFVVHALRPVPETVWSTYHIQPRVCSPEEAEPSFLADAALCIFANVPLEPSPRNPAGTLSGEFLDRLKLFVEEGHGLMVFAGPLTEPADYNTQLFDKRGLLPTAVKKGWQVDLKDAQHLDPASADRESYLARFAERPLDSIRQVDVVEALDIEPPTTGSPRVLLTYTNGKPAVLSRRVGEGDAIFVTTSAEPRWTNFPVRPTFLPFLHLTLNHVLARQMRGFNATAGQPLRLTLPAGQSASAYVLVSPDGREDRLSPAEQTSSGRPQVKSGDISRAGLYRIESKGSGTKQSTVFAVSYDSREVENLASLSNDEIDATLGFKPIHVNATAEGIESPDEVRSKSEWTVWILGVVLLVYLGEMLLAWVCGRAW